MPRKLPTISLSYLRPEPAAPRPKESNSDPLPGTVELREALHSLPALQREVVERRFGFANGEEESLEVIGNCLGITRQAVQYRERKALAKLRKLLEDKHLA